MAIRHIACTLAVAAALTAGSAQAADQYGLSKGTPDLKSAGPLAFGPAGILFIGDTKGAAVFAVRTGETSGDPSGVEVNVEGVNVKVAEQLGVSSQDLQINDLAVNPASGTVYLSVSRGAPSAGPAIVRIDADGHHLRVVSRRRRVREGGTPQRSRRQSRAARPPQRQLSRLRDHRPRLR